MFTKKWEQVRGNFIHLEMYNPKYLDLVRCQFYSKTRKKNGKRYDPGSVRLIQVNLNCCLIRKMIQILCLLVLSTRVLH